MTMNPDLGFPALNVMLLIGTETARYGTARESGMLTAEAGRMMGDDHRRPLPGCNPLVWVVDKLLLRLSLFE